MSDAGCDLPPKYLRGTLQAYCRRTFTEWDGLEIKAIEDITSGWESEVYAFDLLHGPAKDIQPLILRLYAGEHAFAKAEREFIALRRLHNAGYPVPRPYRLERRNSPFGNPFVLIERIAGRPMLSSMLDVGQVEQRALIALFCDLFARLHRLDWHQFIQAERGYQAIDPYVFVDRWFILARQSFTHYSKYDFLPVLEWLETKRNELFCLEPAPVHLDFHPNNILLRGDGSAVVIDWTGFDVSDARFDLAWTLVLSYAYLGAEWRDQVLKGYELMGGKQVEQIEIFEVFACLRRLYEMHISLSQGAGRQGMHSRAEADMKAQKGAYQKVYHLLLHRTGIRIPEIERYLSES